MKVQLDELLIDAKELIKLPANWTKGDMCLNARRQTVPIKSAEAVCFCSVGAVRRAAINRGASEWSFDADEAVLLLAKVIYPGRESGQNTGGVVNFNDNMPTTHYQVMCVFDDAIKLAKAIP